ncbi:MAG: acyltransferase family protein [Collinsella sp.]|nr:acyltransferase family protein [Collinsella sp.]
MANGTESLDPQASTEVSRTADKAARRNRYIPALDGIRALAVVAVVLYHLGFRWIQGGLLGVTMFFAISGFIITRLLLNEFSQTGKIDLKSFWIRRARRLLPAIVALIVVVILLCAIFNRVMLTKMRPDILPSLLFFNNWWQILQNVSYFDALGDPSPLTHFWSLAIEEQFYLIWPVLLFALLSIKAPHAAIRRGILAMGAVSALAMALLYTPALDPSRIYYGTDTRVFSLLLGAWLAFIPLESMTPRGILALVGADKLLPAAAEKDLASNRSTQIAGIVGLLGLVGLFVMSNGYSAFQYRGGMLLCTLLTLALIAACVQPEGPLVRLFSLKPLVWIGTRSYSIYLWHFPLLTLMNPVADIRSRPWWLTVIQLAIVLVVAEASFRLIEDPFRHGLLGRVVARLRSGDRPADLAKRHVAPVALTTAAVLAAAICLVAVPNTSALSEEGAALLADGKTPGDDVQAPEGDAKLPEGAYDVLMIGDSVSLRTIPIFQETFPHGYIDARKNRQFTAGVELLDQYLSNGQVGRVVVIALGTNGLVTDESIDALMQRIGEDRIAVLVNTRSPQPWVGPTNEAIARAADRYPNVRVIDWFGFSEGRNDLFDGDGTHLSTTGAEQYIDLIHDNVRKDLPVHPEDHLDLEVIESAKRVLDGGVHQLSTELTPKERVSTEGE